MSQALQSALSGEYATIFAYGRAGARLNDTGKQTALDYLAIHTGNRDLLREWLVDAGEQPGAPAPAYALPDPVKGPAAAEALLATVELRLVPLYTGLIDEVLEDPERLRWVVGVIRGCALRAQSWGAPGQAFPWPADLSPPQ